MSFFTLYNGIKKYYKEVYVKGLKAQFDLLGMF